MVDYLCLHVSCVCLRINQWDEKRNSEDERGDSVPVIYGKYSPPGDLNIFLTVFVSRAFVGRSRAFCLRWTAGTCCCCRWRGRAATAPPCPTSTSTTSFPASHRSARTQDASSKRWEQTHTHTECRASLVLDFQNKSLHFLSLFHVQRCLWKCAHPQTEHSAASGWYNKIPVMFLPCSSFSPPSVLRLLWFIDSKSNELRPRKVSVRFSYRSLIPVSSDLSLVL